VRAWAGKAAAVLGLAGALGLGSAGVVGAATNPNLSFARTQGPFGVSWGFPFTGFGVTFGTHHATNLSFRVNGQSFTGSNFSVPYVTGNEYVQSSANASSSFCQGCETNAVAITVDVVSGPITAVVAPTNAVVNNSYCTACNTLAADYTFVVSPGVQAQITPAGLAALTQIAATLNAEVNSTEPSTVLAGQVVDALNQIQADLGNTSLVDPPLGTPPPNVQRFGNIQYATS
jgi:hypothetical protein